MARMLLETYHDESGYPGRPIQAGRLRVPPPMQIYLGAPIGKLCQNPIVSDLSQNHCCHFVSHVMNYEQVAGAMNCTLRRSGPGVPIRVNELFNIAPNRGWWGPPDGDLEEPCLVFASVGSNVQQWPGQPPTMHDHPFKHVGIFTEGKIWHYSTRHGRVFADPPPVFRAKFAGAYHPNPVFFSSGLLRA
jgi:hypothetical protein